MDTDINKIIAPIIIKYMENYPSEFDSMNDTMKHMIAALIAEGVETGYKIALDQIFHRNESIQN